MRLLLLQEERYRPTYGGGHKANRRLLEELAARGHECLAVCPGGSGPADSGHRGVAVEGLDTADLAARTGHVHRRIEGWRPDLVLVADDGRSYLLPAALAAAPGRVVFLVHNHRHLPFGPLAARPDAAQAARLRRARAVLVMSRYSRDYVARHGGLDATVVSLPVDGPGEPPLLGAPGNRFVTLVKPIAEKGLEIFLELADLFPRVDFAAVPTWGSSPRPAEAAATAALRARPNVRLLPPADDVGEILRLTRVLLVPSLFPETWGLIVPEAMVRGVPVIASDAGALVESRLGTDFQLPVRAMTSAHEAPPPQDAGPWAEVLEALLRDRETWERCARRSREAGLAHWAATTVEPVEELLEGISLGVREGAA